MIKENENFNNYCILELVILLNSRRKLKPLTLLFAGFVLLKKELSS